MTILGLPVRIVVFYASALGSAGCAPFLALLLAEAGLADALVPLALAVLPFGVLVGGPLWARIADASGAPGRVLRIASALCVAATVGLLVAPGGVSMAACLAVWGLARAPLVPIADGLTVRILAGDRRRYGQIRAVGSVAFLAVAWSAGAIRDRFPEAPLVASFVMISVATITAWTLPEPPALPARAAADRAATWAFARQMAPFLVLSVLHGVALAGFDSYWSLHVDRLGLPAWVAGTGIAAAVAVEVGIMMSGRILLDRVGPGLLLLAAVVAGAVQWTCTVWVVDPASLIAVQGLRGVAFGAFWISGVALLSEHAPPSVASTAQSLLPASSYGAGFLACSAIASVALANGGTPVLFMAFAAVEVAAIAAAITVLLGASAPSSSSP